MHFPFRIAAGITLFVLAVLFPISGLKGQDLPLGYISYYNQDCASKTFQTSLERTAPNSWQLSKYKCTILYSAEADSLKPNLYPQNQGIIPNLILGEYIMEFEFKLLDSCKTDSSGFFFLSPVKECGNYYAFGFSSDSLTFYYPNANSGSSRIASKKHGVNIQDWTKVKVIRNILKRSITFEITGNTKTEVVFTDRRLVMGYVGFGTQNVNSAIRNIRIWAPTAFQDRIYSCQ